VHYSYTSVRDGELARALREHRESSLSATLQFAKANSGYYQRLLESHSINCDTAVDVLRQLPSLSPDEWQAHRSRIRTRPISDVVFGFTGATTGKPKIYLSTLAERRALQEAAKPDRRWNERVLNLVGPRHGLQSAEDFGPNGHTMLVTEPSHLEQVADLLERRISPYYELPAIEAVLGTVNRVLVLSLYLLGRRNRLDDLGIKRLIVTPAPSPRSQKLLEEWWGARVVELYGVSELRMCNAELCEHCSCYHLPPTCFGEYLDPDDWTPISAPSRCGVLAVTVFYPFVELEPRIRYRTGDLVEVAQEPCPFWGEAGFRLLGREEYAVRLNKENWIAPVRCYLAIADIPDVSRSVPPTAPMTDTRYVEAGVPRFRIEKAEGKAILHVELRYDPIMWPDGAERVRKQVALALGTDDVKVVLHRPGDLSETCSI
jgi:hypothetical protein